MTMLLEHKNSEPAMKILMRDIGMTMYVISKVKEKGVDTSNLKVNMDWQHLIMNGENLAEYASLLASENLLGHQHGNSGWGSFDDDNMVGASFFMQTLELALALRRYGYGKNGERVGFDLFPYTEDQVEAVKRSIYHWEFIDSLAGKIDEKALKAAQANHDAVAAYDIIYRTLGLDDKFIQKVHDSRRKSNMSPVKKTVKKTAGTAKKVKDLLSRMTLEEKVAQLADIFPAPSGTTTSSPLKSR